MLYSCIKNQTGFNTFIPTLNPTFFPYLICFTLGLQCPKNLVKHELNERSDVHVVFFNNEPHRLLGVNGACPMGVHNPLSLHMLCHEILDALLHCGDLLLGEFFDLAMRRGIADCIPSFQ